MLAGLLEHPEDAADAHLPLLLWWGLESMAGSHDALLKFFRSPVAWTTPIRPAGNTLAENLMRRWALTGSRADLLSCASLLSLAPDSTHRHALARAFTSTLEGRPLPVMPEQLATDLASIDEPFAMILEVRGGSADSAGRALEFVSNPDTRNAFRAQLIRALGDVRALPKETVPVFLDLVSSAEPIALKQTAFAALQSFDDPEIGRRIAGLYPGLSTDLQLAAESLLASRASWAQSLSAALDDGIIRPASLQSDTIAKLRRHRDKTVRAAVERHFGRDASPTSVSDDRLQRMALVARRGGGDPMKGRELYRGKTGCAACHVLFGEGGRIGPDLTPYDRRNLEAMLLAIVNPAAEIREGYENITITTRDGRLLSGFKVEADDHRLVLRGLDGQNLTVAREDILSLEASEHSLMPEGLLNPLTDAELRDFFAFLSSTTPPM
jgi:putative heme-binding domain-containing protein